MNKGEWGKIKAFFDIETEEGFVVKGFKLVQGINGLFVGFPSQKGNDDEYYDTVWAEKDLREELSQMAIDHYGQEIMPTEGTIDQDNAQPSAATTIDTTVIDTSDSITDDDIPF